MYALSIDAIDRRHSIPDGTDFLEVSFSISREGEVEYRGTHGFPLGTSEEELRGAMERVLATYEDDKKNAEANAELDSLNAQADEVIASLSGTVIN